MQGVLSLGWLLCKVCHPFCARCATPRLRLRLCARCSSKLEAFVPKCTILGFGLEFVQGVPPLGLGFVHGVLPPGLALCKVCRS